uniref:Uncharacterized protein n=1 Tax=Glossina brevipalpis TaxID=37001 RepID=A0A1A9WUB3_9MUSC
MFVYVPRVAPLLFGSSGITFSTSSTSSPPVDHFLINPNNTNSASTCLFHSLGNMPCLRHKLYGSQILDSFSGDGNSFSTILPAQVALVICGVGIPRQDIDGEEISIQSNQFDDVHQYEVLKYLESSSLNSSRRSIYVTGTDVYTNEYTRNRSICSLDRTVLNLV